MNLMVIIPIGTSPKPATQKLIDNGTLKFIMTNTGGITGGSPRTGHYYEVEGSKEELDEIANQIKA